MRRTVKIMYFVTLQSLLWRIVTRLVSWYERGKEYVFSLDEVSLVMIVTTIGCLAVVYSMCKSMLSLGDNVAHHGQQQPHQQVFDHRQERFRQQYERFASLHFCATADVHVLKFLYDIFVLYTCGYVQYEALLS